MALKGISLNPPPQFGVNGAYLAWRYGPLGDWNNICLSSDFTGPQGATGADGAQGLPGTNGTNGLAGATGPAGPSAIGSPNTLTPVFGTVYQATDTTKPSFVSAMIEAVYTVTVASTLANTVELRIGSSSTGLSAGSSGTAVATFKNSLTGITLAIGMGTINRNQLSTLLPAAWYWCIRHTVGTTATIVSATDQSLG